MSESSATNAGCVGSCNNRRLVMKMEDITIVEMTITKAYFLFLTVDHGELMNASSQNWLAWLRYNINCHLRRIRPGSKFSRHCTGDNRMDAARVLGNPIHRDIIEVAQGC
jgi:hypothetical protein